MFLHSCLKFKMLFPKNWSENSKFPGPPPKAYLNHRVAAKSVLIVPITFLFPETTLSPDFHCVSLALEHKGDIWQGWLCSIFMWLKQK